MNVNNHNVSLPPVFKIVSQNTIQNCLTLNSFTDIQGNIKLGGDFAPN